MADLQRINAIAADLFALGDIQRVCLVEQMPTALERALRRRGVNAYSVSLESFEQAQPATAASPDAPSIVCLLDGLETLSDDRLARVATALYRCTGRALYARVGFTVDRSRHFWENTFFRAGFRKHPLEQRVSPYESLEFAGAEDRLIFERTPEPALARYPLPALAAARDLHMDMLRESGRRSDAHVARYHLAAPYVRPNDVVLDAACGLGYGAAILWDASMAGAVVGIDESAFAAAYGEQCFTPGRSGLSFRRGDVCDLSHIEDNSVDVVVSFETVEHVLAPERFLTEVQRVLTPGGRFICSVPNLWVDETGQDPNPHHHHVFDHMRLRDLCNRFLCEEQMFAQTAGGGMKLGSAPRSLREVEPGDGANTDAEWWLYVGMKDPIRHGRVPYRETIYPSTNPANIVAFARDYENPWLVRSMVSIGLRARSKRLLERFAHDALANHPLHTPDAGAALCVLGYRWLDDELSSNAETETLVEQLHAFVLQPPGNAHFERWRISAEYLLALVCLKLGDRSRGLALLESCAARDCLVFSPLLATKTIDAAFQAGWLLFLDGDVDAARKLWRRGVTEAKRVLSGDWSEIIDELVGPPLFAMREATGVMDAATRCANGLSLLQTPGPSRPAVLVPQLFHSLSHQVQQMEQTRRGWYEPHIAALEKELRAANHGHEAMQMENARLSGELAALYKLKADWLDPEITRLHNELDEADRIRREWFEPRLERLEKLEAEHAALRAQVAAGEAANGGKSDSTD